MGHWFGLNVLWLPIADMLVLPAAVLGLLSATGLMRLRARFLIWPPCPPVARHRITLHGSLTPMHCNHQTCCARTGQSDW